MTPVGGAPGLNQILQMRDEILSRNDALRDLKTAGAASSSATQGAGGPAEGFTGALNDALQSVNASQTRASDISAAYERGEVVDVAQVMLARQEAGIAFEATLQVRNKLLSAYQDIMRLGV